MEKVTIWYLTDNDRGKNVAYAIKGLGLNVQLLLDKDFNKINILSDEINMFIIDIKKRDFQKIMSIIRDDSRIHNYLKFVVLYKRQRKKALSLSFNMLHVEFLSRPLDRKEFILLLEKSIVVERYRDMMKLISMKAEERIEAYENLMDISRKDIFETDKEKEAFVKILEYEKHLMEEQGRLNRAIKDFTLIRQKELFEVKNRIKAEEMLADLRRNELIDAKDTIKAQESVIDYSGLSLIEANQIIEAVEKVQELSRAEAMKLHDNLKNLFRTNRTLVEENSKLKERIRDLLIDKE